MRCLFCGKRLALLRKLTDGEFCSTAHRKRYLEEEQKLALARLIEEQHRTDHRRVGPDPVRLPAAERKAHEIAGFRPQQPAVKFKSFSPLAPEQKFEESIHPQMAERHGQSPAFARALPVVGGSLVECVDDPAVRRTVSDAGDEVQPQAVLSGLRPDLAAAGGLAVAWPALPELVGAVLETAPKDSLRAVARSGKTSIFLKELNPVAPCASGLGELEPAAVPPIPSDPASAAACVVRAVAAPEAVKCGPAVALAAQGGASLRTTGIAVERNLDAERIGEAERCALEAPWRFEPAAPAGHALAAAPPAELALPLFALHPEMPAGAVARGLSEALEAEPSLPAPGGSWTCLARTADAGDPACAVLSGPTLESRSSLPQPATPRAGFTAAAPTVVERPLRLEACPDRVACDAGAVAFPAHSGEIPGFKTAAGIGDASIPAAVPARMELKSSDPAPIEVAPVAVLASRDGRLRTAIRPCMPRIRTHYRPSAVPGARRAAAETAPFHPQPGAWRDVHRDLPAALRTRPCETLVGIAFRPSLCRPAGWRPEAPAAAAFRPRPLLPALRIETVLLKRRTAQPTAEASLPASEVSPGKPWKTAPHFWKMAPADLKWIAVALPAILLVTLISAVGWLPAKRAASPRAAAPAASGALENVVHERWAVVRQNISERAAINLQDDFRGGLAEWEGEGNWAKDWKYDPAGFVLTGALALYGPSRELTDYQFEFLGQIDRKSLNWVFRAADYKNYYAMKIVLLKNGPLPTAAVVRYAVIDGKPDRAVQSPLPITVRSDMFYRVRVNVRDDQFTTTVQGQIVDFWTDRRLGRGGVGFFSEKGERARLRWMEVSHQYDALGRLCALLAPYGIQSGNGSLSRQ